MREKPYDKIGFDYNRTRTADKYLAGRLVSHLQPEIGKCYLDIGCGTGNYTLSAAGKDHQFYGVDPSPRMLEKARVQSPGKRINWLLGNAEELPFQDNCFSGAMATLTIHHWQNLEKAFGELGRVLKNDGLFVIFTAFPDQLRGYWLNHYFPKMMASAISQMPEFETISRLLGKTAFEIRKIEKYFVRPDLEDFFLYSGKQKPELYLDEILRGGISAFCSPANKNEVAAGIKRLGEDIRTGSIEMIKAHFNNDCGDYAFVAARLKK